MNNIEKKELPFSYRKYKVFIKKGMITLIVNNEKYKHGLDRF